jgi:hypothetical protein
MLVLTCAIAVGRPTSVRRKFGCGRTHPKCGDTLLAKIVPKQAALRLFSGSGRKRHRAQSDRMGSGYCARVPAIRCRLSGSVTHKRLPPEIRQSPACFQKGFNRVSREAPEAPVTKAAHDGRVPGQGVFVGFGRLAEEVIRCCCRRMATPHPSRPRKITRVLNVAQWCFWDISVATIAPPFRDFRRSPGGHFRN